MTGHSPSEIERSWDVEDSNWVLAVAHARDLARIQIAKSAKASVNDVLLPFSVFTAAEVEGKKRVRKRKAPRINIPENLRKG